MNKIEYVYPKMIMISAMFSRKM